jgi:hypothetical protein
MKFFPAAVEYISIHDCYIIVFISLIALFFREAFQNNRLSRKSSCTHSRRGFIKCEILGYYSGIYKDASFSF